ncbi:oligoribonuclease [Candidatus Pantoea edessiphila]|uniref:Oligoribonuclease n=1 Tax=Candidatus Pantoea edessiphila TaxID=2044610 RepID=A0A2P5T1Q9_9GAMM|nr:oligoribonuclease [Candidatus Pantoea edessiphila]PPI88493.1 oligoribonuclease [Candidatus Pantoea edessiphila]
MTINKNEKNLIWLDLEMTGLNPEKDRIIEIATVITDVNLNILAKGPIIPIYQSNNQLKLMDTWNLDTHTNSGLLDKVKKSKFKEKEAEKETINFLKKWIQEKTSPMCGNSITQDRRFLFKYMPELENYFHYRQIDVSTLKELAFRWNPAILLRLRQKKSTCPHSALNDILNSISELNYYRKHFLKI